jgi:hypothetical protein
VGEQPARHERSHARYTHTSNAQEAHATKTSKSLAREKHVAFRSFFIYHGGIIRHKTPILGIAYLLRSGSANSATNIKCHGKKIEKNEKGNKKKLNQKTVMPKLLRM